MWSLECKHQMLTHDGRRTTTHDGQPLTTIAHHEHFVLRWANKRAQSALGRSTEKKAKGQGEAIILL